VRSADAVGAHTPGAWSPPSTTPSRPAPAPAPSSAST
jgi:hypothetical protein